MVALSYYSVGDRDDVDSDTCGYCVSMTLHLTVL